MCYELLFKNRRNKRQVHALNMELKKKKIVNIENRNATPTNLNINNEMKNSDFVKKLEMEGPTHFNFLHRQYPNFKHIPKNTNRHKVIIPKLTLDMKNSNIYKRRMKKSKSKSKSTIV